MLFVGEVQRFHADRRLCLVYRFQQLVVAEGRASSLGLPARISGLASHTIFRLTTARVPVTQTIRTKNQMGRASQLWTRNQSLERDFST